MSTWQTTNDPNDPCPYCVSWIDSDPQEDGCYTDLIPYGPNAAGDLVIVDRIYNGAHPECQADVDAYLDERGHA